MNNNSNVKIIAAPLQGFTEAPWRRYHAEVFGGVDEYCAPFVRLEKGEIRSKDLRDTLALPLATAQIICRDGKEFGLLARRLVDSGVGRVDLNLGCPFPPQVRHGRGAGLMADSVALKSVIDEMKRISGVEFSIKMRLGIKRPDEWRSILPLLADAPLRRVTVHPRVAAQQYKGDLNLEQYAALAAELPHPVVFNGDVTSAADYRRVCATLQPAGVMIGRGLLSAPWLAAEIRAGEDFAFGQRLALLLRLHDKLLAHYRATLCGDSQVLSKIKPFWEYVSEADVERKILKALRKSASMSAYLGAVAAIQRPRIK